MKQQTGTTWGAALIIAGTSIGAGMLAMPVETGPAGLLPALMINGVCWLYLVLTGVLFAEVTLLMPAGSNVLSISSRFLGSRSQWVTGATFVFLYVSLLVAYVAGGIPAFGRVLYLFGIPLTGVPLGLCFVMATGLLVWLGTAAVDRINWLLMAGLLLSYLWMVGMGADEVQAEHLMSRDWKLAIPAVPVLFSAYGFHNVIPTLASYLKGDRSQLIRAIVWGMSLPFLVYSVWQWLLIGAVSPDGLEATKILGLPITNVLEHLISSRGLAHVALFFGFFALVTSFLGVSLSMVDFLGDGLGIQQRRGWRRLGLCLLAMGVPTMLAMERPDLFSTALGVAGGFGEAFLNGLFPVALYLVARREMTGHWRVPNAVLWMLALFGIAVMGIEAMQLLTPTD